MRRFFGTVLLLLDGGLLLLFVVGYAARYVHPRYAWGADLVATTLPYLALILVGAAVLVALARRWRLLLLHLVLVVLAAVRFLPPERGAVPAPDDLVLLTFNTSRGGGARADDQGRALTALVRAETPDLVAIQEAFVEYHPSGQAVRPSETLAALVDSLGYRTIGPDGSRGATYTPQPVLARLDLIEQTQIVLEPTTQGEPTSRVLRTHFRWAGREAVHYNLHLRSFGNRKPWEEDMHVLSVAFWLRYLRQYRAAILVRAREAELIRALLNRETLPVVVSGDFNSTPHNWAFHHLAQGLQDAFLVAGTGWGATYHARWPLARIDHVLVGPQWQIVSAHVSSAPHSDHLPLVVHLRWRP